MGDSVEPEDLEVARMKQVFVSDLDGIVPTLRKPRQEGVKLIYEISALPPLIGVEVRELEEQGTDLRPMRSERGKEAADMNRPASRKRSLRCPARLPYRGRFRKRFTAMSSVTLIDMRKSEGT